MISVIRTDIIQTVLETSECFLSKYTNTVHILATGTEEQAVYSGYLVHPSHSILPPAIRSEIFIVADASVPLIRKKLKGNKLQTRLVFAKRHDVGDSPNIWKKVLWSD
jgi:hypothetical protein